jgi:hypothetical protein
MRATTVRFSHDLWHQLEREAQRAGVSVAQFVRDAALIRLTWERMSAQPGAYEHARRTAAEEA